MNDSLLIEVKGYLRIDYDDEDTIIEGFISAAKQYLLRAGVPEQPDNDLYNLVIKMMVALFYENRNAGEGDLKMPAVVLNFITQLSISGQVV